MNRLVLFMARRRTTWILWMLLGLPVLLLMMALDFGVEAFRAVRHSWRWQWRAEITEFLQNYGEDYRKSLRSLGLRPESGGKLMRR